MIKNKIILIANIPPPITGARYANKVSKEALEDVFETVLISEDFNFSNEKTIFKKIIQTINTFLNVFFKTKKNDLVYICLNQTKFGFIRHFFILFLSRKINNAIVHLHGSQIFKEYDEGSFLFKQLAKYFFLRNKAIIVLGAKYLNHPLLKKHIDKSYVIKNFYDFEGFSDTTFRAFDPDKSPIKIIFFSNIIESKGIIDVIDACKLLYENGVEVELNIAGAILDKNFGKNFYSRINKNKFIKFHGALESKKKWKLLHESHIFVLPTYYKQEGLPISLIEAMASGCFIVTCNNGVINEVVAEKGAIFVMEKDPQSIFKVINDLRNNHVNLNDSRKLNIQHSKNFTKKKYQQSLIKLISKM